MDDLKARRDGWMDDSIFHAVHAIVR